VGKEGEEDEEQRRRRDVDDGITLVKSWRWDARLDDLTTDT
jgi:hypothetical protein